jgi:hypothetical protein
MRLADLQQRMSRAILTGEPRDLPPLAPGPIPAAAALAVHTGTVRGALCNALRLTFPTVDALVGEGFFDQTALAYATLHPQRSARLSGFGARFADFLEAYAPAADLAYLADVARLDLAVARALAAPDALARRHIALDAHVRLALPISLESLSLSYPADLIRAALDEGDDEALAAVDLTPRPRALAVWRAGRHAVVRPLGPAAGLFLAEVLAGAGADQALASVFLAHQPQAALEAIQAEVFAAPFAQVTQAHPKD